ncbi:MAG: molybdopterin-guanine dinucleotide biosynthesis protein B [bacterium]
MSAPVVCIVGRSNSGKTTLIERLIPVLVRKGYRLATVKHDVHGFEIDREGKDSWRHRQAGASTVILSSPARIAVVREVGQELDLEQIRSAWAREVDLLLTEGYKRSPFPKVEVTLACDSEDLLCTREDLLAAVVSNRPPFVDVPFFREGEVDRLAAWLEETYIRPQTRPALELLCRGRPFPLDPAARSLLEETLRTLLSGLPGWDPTETTEIRVRAREPG